ncbi:hypothetical protein [Beijerinckia sp. L45]|uniref:hypothetical protein n=1 Tax=Beijerinckia sp. L45 TaxID=1641855 RepID=UPI00131C0798|nr:hypothetical protein [Beijerinckia sp. L45]
MASDPNDDITLNKVEARQGSTKPKMIYVLIAGVVLVVVAFVVASMFFQHPTTP